MKKLRSGSRPVVFVTSGSMIYHPRHYHLLACGLHDAGLPTVVVGRTEQGEKQIGAVPVEGLRASRTRFGRIASVPALLFKALRLRPSVVQVNNLELLPWAALLRIALRVPVIYDAREDYPSYMLLKSWIPQWLRKPVSWLVAVGEPWLSRWIDAVVVADPGTGSRFAGRARRVLLIYNFPSRRLAERAPEEPIFDVTYNGTISAFHIDSFITTALELKRRKIGVHWCLAALEFGADERKRLESRLREAGVIDAFTIFYNLPFAEMGPLLGRSRIGFIPLPDAAKFRRNIPGKLFEFMAAGKPVVASDLPPIRSLVGNAGCCFLAEPEHAVAYADGIQRLLENPDLARLMGRRGRALVLEGMNSEACVGPYVELNRRLMQRAR